MTRDPRSAPRPGDWLATGDVLIRVDHVALGLVHVAVFELTAQQPHAVLAVPLLEFAKATRAAGVIEMSADDPRQFATILTARS